MSKLSEIAKLRILDRLHLNTVALAVFGFALVVVVDFNHCAFASTSEEFVTKAQKFIDKDENKAAIIELKNAIQKDQNNGIARVMLAEVYIDIGDGVNAEKELSRAHLLKVDYAKIALPLAKAYTLQRKHKQVLSIKIEENLPAEIEAEIRVMYAQAYLNLRNLKNAKEQLDKAAFLDKNSAEAILGLAQIAMLENDLSTATGYVKKVIKSKPDNSEAWTLDGEIARLKGNYAQAKTSFEKALALKPKNIQAMLGVSNVYIMIKEMDKALVQVNLVLKKLPKHTLANYYFGLAQYRKGDLKKAEQALKVALQTNPDHAPSQQLMGAIQYQTGRLEQAEYYLSKVVSLNPSNLGAVKLLAAVRLKNQRNIKAIEILMPLLGNYPRDPQLLALIGSAYLQNNQPNKGITYLQKSVDLDPKSANTLTQLALAHLSSGDDTKAVAMLTNAIDLEQGVLQADVLLTLTYLRNEEYQKALKQAQLLDNKKANNPVVKNLLGSAYLGLKQYDKAKQLFNETLKLDPKFTTASMNLGRLAEQQNNHAKAIKIYQNLISKNRNQIEAYMALARVFERQGDLDKAVNIVKKASLANPRNPVVGLYLINYYIGEGFPNQALELAKQIKQHNQNNIMVIRAYGIAQVNAKDYSGAISTFRRIVEKAPDSSDAHYMLGNAYLKNQQYDQARASMEKSLKIDKNNMAANVGMAKLEVKNNKSNKAITIAKQLQKIYPNRAEGFVLEGDIYATTKSYQKAASAYQKGLKKQAHSEIVLKLAKVYKKLNDNNSRKQLLDDWVNKHPQDVQVKLFLANEYLAAKQNDKAKKIYESVLDKNKNNVAALNNLALIYADEKNKRALDFAKRAYELNSESPQVADTYGWILVNQGQVDKGLVLLQQASLNAPYLKDIRYHLAFALHKSGRGGEAKKELTRLLSADKNFSEAKNAKILLDSL